MTKFCEPYEMLVKKIGLGLRELTPSARGNKVVVLRNLWPIFSTIPVEGRDAASKAAELMLISFRQ